jgi:hypothetical protein
MFGSGRIVEAIDSLETENISIVIEGAEFPLTLEFDLLPAIKSISVLSEGEELRPDASGHISIARPTHSIELRITRRDALPQEFSLSQNYPNPFNPATVIGYKLPVTREVGLTVYDMLGRRVATLVHGKQVAGSYSVTWDASGCASGIYICRLQAGSFIASKKLALVR